MYKIIDSVEELYQEIEIDKNWTGAECSLRNRYPLRFVLFESFNDFNAFVQECSNHCVFVQGMDKWMDEGNDDELMTYSQLARPEIKRIKSLKITMNTLRKGTPLDVKYIIFQRVNTAGEPLTPQEMRHALNQGVAASFIKELSEMESFKKATNYSLKKKRMQDRDFVNRFVAFFIGYQEYSGDLDMFLNDKMGELNKMTPDERNNIKIAFDKSMKCCYQIFKDDTFRRRYDIADKRKPISKSVYDTLSVNIAWLSDEERTLLLDRADKFKSGMVNLFNNDKFNSSISTGTGQKYNVNIRFSYVNSLIKETLKI